MLTGGLWARAKPPPGRPIVPFRDQTPAQPYLIKGKNPVGQLAGVPSRNGVSIIFASGRDGPGRCEIYAIEADGAGLRRLTTPSDKAGSNFPAWSYDRSTIAFTNNRGGKNQIYVANSDGSQPRCLTPPDAEAAVPSWSPKGDRLAFTSNLHGSLDIWTIMADGAQPRRLTTGPTCWGARWSPDGERIAFFGPADDDPKAPEEIFVMTSDGEDLRRITRNDTRETYPDWSPDGKTLLVSSLRGGSWDTYVIDVENGSEERITNTPAGHHGSWLAAWSPSGGSIVFVSDRHAEFTESLSRTEIYVMDLTTSVIQRLTTNECFDVHPDWWNARYRRGRHRSGS